MTKKIIWRLKETPTSENLRELVKDGILSKDEAREILFSEVESSERSVESLKEEITFLRETIQRLTSRSEIVTVIKEVEKPYVTYPWYKPYITWYGGTSGNTTLYTSSNFNDIQTF